MSWLVDLIQSLSDRLFIAGSQSFVAPLLDQVSSHMKGVQALINDRVVTQLSNAVLLRRDAVVSSIVSPVPRELLNKLRSSPLLSELMFDLSLEDLEDFKKKRHERLMFQAVKSSQAMHRQPPEARQPKGRGSQKGPKPRPQVSQQPFRDQQRQSQPKQSSSQSGPVATQQKQVSSQTEFKSRPRRGPQQFKKSK